MALDSGMGMQNQQVMSSLDPAQMGQADPQQFANIPHVDAGPQEQAPQLQEQAPDELRKHIEAINIAESLDEDQLKKIAEDVVKGYEDDLTSREPWERHIEEWTKLAAQVTEQKTYPWPGASNVKYPLISTAAMQFNARAYPSLVPSNGKLVATQVIGKDPDGAKKDRADRVSKFMSWQLMDQMKGWEEDMDRLLMMLPIVGTIFKKTYYDPIKKYNCSCLVLPRNLVVNYWATCLEDAQRVTEVIEMSQREVKEKQLAGIYSDLDIGPPRIANFQLHRDFLDDMLAPGADDKTTPHLILEQHTFLDLNDDGYSEPYIITVDHNSKKVLRIVARFDDKGIHTDDKGKVIKIDPICYYTKFPFIPNPDGSFYDIGFGHLLGPLNEAVNSLINQLVDAGTIGNLQSGFIGKGLRLRMGETRLAPGEWRAVNSTGDDLKKQIVPLPSKEPSHVLFQLMGSLISSGKELASVAEIFVGKMPGQNTPATTTMATIDQGMKVFTAVYKRIYRALQDEFEKLFRLNEVFLDYDTYVNVVDTTVNPTDFKDDGYDIMPGADPAAISQTEKLVKAQALMELLPTGIVDPVKVITRLMDAMEIPNWQELLSQSATGQGGGQQQPNPQMLELQMKQQAEAQKAQLAQQESQQDMALKVRDQQFQQQMQQVKMASDAQIQQQKTAASAQSQMARDRANQYRLQQQMQQDAQVHQQTMQHNQEAHVNTQRSKLSQAAAQSKTGNTKK